VSAPLSGLQANPSFGSFDPWGGQGFAKCTALLNEEFERVFYKNNYGFGITIFNLVGIHI
jgi:hypothetical protein